MQRLLLTRRRQWIVCRRPYFGWLTVDILRADTVMRRSDVTCLCVGDQVSCRFPRQWRGRYFQSGLGDVFISERDITTKGHCVQHSRDYFLLYSRSVTSLATWPVWRTRRTVWFWIVTSITENFRTRRLAENSLKFVSWVESRRESDHSVVKSFEVDSSHMPLSTEV